MGLAFKGGTDDICESPAIAIVQALQGEGAEVAVYDPAATERAKQVLGDSVTYSVTAYEACQNARAAVMLTDWQDFAELDLKVLKDVLRHPIVVDGRNIFDCEQMRGAGFQYFSVGRPPVIPASASSKRLENTNSERSFAAETGVASLTNSSKA